LETIMSFPRSPAVAVWLLAAAGTFGSSEAWANDAETGKLHPWVLLAVFWGAALLSVSIHYLLLYLPHAALWARRAWHRRVGDGARFGRRVRAHWWHAVHGWETSRRRALQRLRMRAPLAWVQAAQARETMQRTARRVWQQQPMAGALRAPGMVGGALIGWSRSALKALRA
jgi:hypothetical protein